MGLERVTDKTKLDRNYELAGLAARLTKLMNSHTNEVETGNFKGVVSREVFLFCANYVRIIKEFSLVNKITFK